MLPKSVRALALSAAAAAIVFSPMASASAASTYLITSGATSVSGAELRAGTVQLNASSTSPFDSVTFKVGSVVVGSSTDIVLVDGKYVATTTADLTGIAPGATQLTTRYVSGKIGSSVTKSITVTEVDNTNTEGEQLPVGTRGAYNTGIPQGVQLDSYTGPLTITTPGTVIEGKQIDGCLRIAAADVQVINTAINCAKPQSTAAIEVISGKGYRLQVTDTEINGMRTAEVGVGYGNYTLTRVNIHDTNDGVRLGYSSHVKDSYIHHGARQGDKHPDAAQTTSGTNMSVTGSHLDWRDGTDYTNSALMLGSETGSMLTKNAYFANNYLDGGNVTVNIKASINTENMVFEGNVFGGHTRFNKDVQTPRELAGLFGPTNTQIDGDVLSISRV